MNWKKNKVFLVILILCVCILGIGTVYYLSCDRKRSFTVEVWEVDTKGYGYKIIQNEQAVIVQPFVPGIPGKRYFKHANDARRVGQLVRKRLEAREDYTITPEDLKRLKIASFTE